MLEWCVYYDDGSTYSNLDGRPWDAPKSGVQAIVVLDPAVGWFPLYGTRENDFFCYDAAWEIPRWRNMEHWGFQEYMREPGLRLVLFGRWMGNHAHQALKTRITNELGDRQRYPDEVDR